MHYTLTRCTSNPSPPPPPPSHRYKDQIFFTWNKSRDTLSTILQIVKTQRPNVHFRTTIGTSVHFLDAYIENRNGQVHSRVYHDPRLQRYTLPYVVGHAKLEHSNWLRSALIRAACYCSSVEDFQQERIYLELTFLVNGYSFLFVESHVQHFFDYFEASSRRYESDQAQYHSFRHLWFDFVDMQHTRADQLQTLDDKNHVIRFSYLYEYGARCEFNRHFREFWSTQFATHPLLSKDKSKIVLTTKQEHSLNALLSRDN